ncbi:hypothetical protein KUV50_17845 [Membranicola marinus]|uniref:UbiA prenyltransferase family protein n=1 Tax=Membranihabitans marinus TaxID=1227546 RepID=A0A953HRP1_9BACT|nr:hypothetical protein [Membranihabitans marinus]MBY5960019.1 hypothetical protein [Membranihabitans marinus]
MTKKERSIEDIMLRSHLWLGICAVLCTWGTFVLLQRPVSFRYLGFVLVGTMTIYSLHSVLTQKSAQDAPAAVWPALVRGTLILGAVVTVILYLFLNRINQLILLFPAGMALLYVFPVYRGKRLKDFPFIKIIAIVLAWTTVTYWIPVHSISHWWSETGFTYLLVDRLLFFFALAIPFDIRDIQYDQSHHLKTIPNTIGLHNSQNLALFALFLASGFMAMGMEALGLDGPVKIGLLVVYLLLGAIIIQLKRLPGPKFYSWGIDGVLFLYGFVLLLLVK